MAKYPPSIKPKTDRLDEKWTEAKTPNQGRQTDFGKRGTGPLKRIWGMGLILGVWPWIENDSTARFDLENQCQFLIKLSIFLSVIPKDLDSVNVPVNQKATSFSSPPCKANTSLSRSIYVVSGAISASTNTESDIRTLQTFSKKLH